MRKGGDNMLLNYEVTDLSKDELEVRRTVICPSNPYSRTRGHRHANNEPEYLWVQKGFGVLLMITDREIVVPLIPHHVYRVLGFHVAINNTNNNLVFVTAGIPGTNRIYEFIDENVCRTACLLFQEDDDYDWLSEAPLYFPVVDSFDGFLEFARTHLVPKDKRG